MESAERLLQELSDLKQSMEMGVREVPSADRAGCERRITEYQTDIERMTADLASAVSQLQFPLPPLRCPWCHTATRLTYPVCRSNKLPADTVELIFSVAQAIGTATMLRTKRYLRTRGEHCSTA